MSQNDYLVKKSINRMLAFMVVSLCAAVIMIWQWVVTINEIDSLAEGDSRYQYIIPKTN